MTRKAPVKRPGAPSVEPYPRLAAIVEAILREHYEAEAKRGKQDDQAAPEGGAGV